MSRRTPDAADLVAQSEHVLYEIEMLCTLADYFESGQVDHAVARLPRQGEHVRSALVESFAVHTRQLIDFLSPVPERSKADDVFAVDYVPAWRFDSARWSAERERVNKYVAHLTLRRALHPAESEFPTRMIRRDLGAELERFVRALPADVPVIDAFKGHALTLLGASETYPLDVVLGDYRAQPYTGGTATTWTPPERSE